ncbi:ABC transporter ATP-binding protein [Thermoflavimicrobium daqui]|uniref:Multidrug ABC transporter permease n=1 Tax=Thermoflavimicrobium daqui TaxID=2137476 RepID=A0A364K4X1_9BACL|nr:ABC transporter ATP-binding protein [Thermoflavimicrobium daqui]RAL24424.1 multidrug ABC transporter permease [Thermoflavimicrobium daqui]
MAKGLKREVNFGWLWKTTTPPKKQLILGIVLTLANTGVGLLIPLFIKDIVEGLKGGFSFIDLVPALLLVVLQIALGTISMYLLSYVGLSVVRNLREKTWSKLLQLPMPFYKKNKAGEVSSRVINDTSVVSELLSSDIAEFIAGVLQAVGSAIFLFVLDVPLTLVLLGSLPLIFLIVIPVSRIIAKISKEYQDKMSEFSGYVTGLVGVVHLVKTSNTEKDEAEKGKDYVNSLFSFGLKRAKIESLLSPLMSTFIYGVVILIVGYGAYRVSQGAITSGELIAYLLYLFEIVTPFEVIARFMGELQETKGSMFRLYEILDEDSESKIFKGKKKPKSCEVLAFKDVQFNYGSKKVLKKISFEAKAGTMTALVGPSGVGKTTLFSLMERFYAPQKGGIYLDGENASRFDLGLWRRMFSYVSQESPIIAGSVRDNLLYGVDKDVSDDELIEAAKLANAHDFIMKLPDDYDTVLDEKGGNLSGGQRQRLAIARAFLRDCKILLLDEVTANLDGDSETMIQESLESLIKDKIVFVIAHRISTIRNADQIVVLNDGKVAGIGTHNELLSNNDYYRRLVHQQFAQHMLEEPENLDWLDDFAADIDQVMEGFHTDIMTALTSLEQIRSGPLTRIQTRRIFISDDN